MIYILSGKIALREFGKSRGNWKKIGTNQEIKKANRPPWGAIGLLAGAGDGHSCANTAPKGRKYGVDGKVQTDRFRADVHGVI